MGAALKLLGINVVGEARKEATAISLMRSMQPNVLLIDMHLSDEHSIAIATLIRKENTDIGIVMLVPCADLRLLGENNSLVPNGSKIVIKNSLNNVANLCEIISDSRVFDASTPATWVNGTVSLHEKALEGMMTQLTDIQIETLRLVADGLTNAEIGRMRYVSEKAVEQIVSRIAQVLNVQPDHGKNIRVQLVGEYFRWIGAPRH
jgi:DNA-binding NarL/FixJ family response regulator